MPYAEYCNARNLPRGKTITRLSSRLAKMILTAVLAGGKKKPFRMGNTPGTLLLNKPGAATKHGSHQQDQAAVER